MLAQQRLPVASRAPAPDCGIPIDSQYFDDSRIVDVPPIGATVVLARVELPQQYCGALECFSQFTDLFARDPAEVATPGLLWQIRSNGQALSPYHQLTAILNPWGYGSFPFSLRLPEGAVVEMIVRRIGAVAPPGKSLTSVGGRLLGRYWFNTAYGAAG